LDAKHENEYNAMLMIREASTRRNINLYWDNLYLVADTFISFLDNLKINQDNFEEEDIENVEIWLDDDLLDDD